VLNASETLVYWLDDRLYLNITNQCSNDCYFCIRKFRKGVGEFNLKLSMEPSTRRIIQALQERVHRRVWREAVFCGFGEPLTRLDAVLEVTSWIRRYTALTVRVDTNGHGYLLNPGRNVAEELREAGVKRVSVSLNAHDSETYDAVCRPRFKNAFESVLEFIRRAKEAGLTVEVTAVRIPEVNVEKVREIASRLGVSLRLREYIPCSW